MLRVRTQIVGTGGSPFLSTAYFAGTNASDASNAVNAMGDFWTAMAGAMDDSLTIRVLNEVDSISETTGELLDVLSTSGFTTAGSAGDDPLPPATQGLLRLITGEVVAGRAVKGRWFIPGATEGSNVGGFPTSGYQTTLVGAIDDLIANADTTLLVWSKKNGQGIAVSGWSVWGQWASLRSRRD